nr:PREDICTED: 26S proteasome non-ATPase regulatory subunit 6-like [Megachile rotundata]
MSNSELCHKTPEYMFLAKIWFKMTLKEHRNEEDLKTKFLDMVTQGNMTKYYENACKEFDWKIDDELLDTMKKANEVTWQELRLPDSSGVEDSEKQSWRKELEFFCQIGDLERAADTANQILKDESNSFSARVEAAFGLFRIAYIKNDVGQMGKMIAQLTHFMEGSYTCGSDWCSRNKLKVYEAVYCLATRNFSRTASLLLDCIPTFESYELLPFKDVVEYTILSGIISFSRSDFESHFNNNGLLQQALLTESPRYREFFYFLYDCHYGEFFRSLAWIESELRANPLFHPHCRYFMREMRLRAYSQLLQAYRTINLSTIAAEFGVTEEYVEQEIAGFIVSVKDKHLMLRAIED